MATETPNAQELEAWIQGVRFELDGVAQELAPLLAKREQLKRRLELLERLRDSYSDRASDSAQAGPNSSNQESVRDYVIARATELLGEEAGPLHINELHARFLARGFDVPGAGAPVNITSHIRHAQEIISPKRGLYVLSRYAKDAKNKDR